MSRSMTPSPELRVGWRVSAKLRGGLAHYFARPTNHPLPYSMCSACVFHDARLFPERMARRRCKTCDRSAKARGMQ